DSVRGAGRSAGDVLKFVDGRWLINLTRSWIAGVHSDGRERPSLHPPRWRRITDGTAVVGFSAGFTPKPSLAPSSSRTVRSVPALSENFLPPRRNRAGSARALRSNRPELAGCRVRRRPGRTGVRFRRSPATGTRSCRLGAGSSPAHRGAHS